MCLLPAGYFFVLFGKGFGCVRRFGILDCRAESGKCVLVWLVLWFGWGFVSKTDEGLLDVSGHAEEDASTFVVPV